MWALGQKAEKSSRLPSECIPTELADEIGDWGCWCFDNAIHFFYTVISNALREEVNQGSEQHPDTKPKYTLAQLLADDFRLPRPLTDKQKSKQVGAAVRAMTSSTMPKTKAKTKDGKPKSMIPPSLERQLRARGIKF